MSRPRFGFLLAMVGVSVLARLLMYIAAQPAVASLLGTRVDLQDYSFLWNFSPLPAICLFGAAFLADRRWAFAIPLAAWLLSDLGIWALTGRLDWAFYGWGQVVVYICLALSVTIGLPLRRHRSVWAVGGAGLMASVQFFLLTNLAVWAFGDGTLYPHTLDGLLQCYAAALPYFRNSLIAMAVFLPVLFSPLAVVRREPSPEFRPVAVAESAGS